MSKGTTPLDAYLKAVDRALKEGNATEHTHRPALKALLESLDGDIVATNEPRRIACGSPDFIVTRRGAPIGYVEAKDVGADLDRVEDSEQLDRYRTSLSNLILTDYLEFRLYRSGQLVHTVHMAALHKGGGLRKNAEDIAEASRVLDAFISSGLPTINSPRELAERMARIARLIHDLIRQVFAQEGARGDLHAQFEAFKKVLIADLTGEQFADMYAQTIAYGLFAARCNHTGKGFSREQAYKELPKTNPFLRKLFNNIAGADLDDRISWAVDDLAEILSRADMGAILKDFGRATRQEDPVVHFYETFLAAYNPTMREMRGVYYTPEPVVSYIVRSIDLLLRSEFKLKAGLADNSQVKLSVPTPHGRKARKEIITHRVQILDPACGTGTFLYAAIAQIRETFASSKGMWPGYVAQHLLPRLYGFELLMAPYAVAHMKLGLELKDTGYDFAADERLRVFLTNSLEEAHEQAGLPLFAQWLADEAAAASEIKRYAPIMVVLGNPPYSGLSANTGAWINGLLRGKDSLTKKNTHSYFEVDGKPLGEKKHWLNDDYVKFVRFAQWRIEQTGYGILGFVTNHGYLDNPTFRGMRQSLMETFDDIYLFDLHGNANKKETALDGSKDENVFDIRQGVAIGLFVKRSRERGSPAIVKHADLYGVRDAKYKQLLELDVASTKWRTLEPRTPFYLFRPQDTGVQPEYEQGWQITDIFTQYTTGIVTARDHLAVDFSRDELEAKIDDFISPTLSDDDARHKYFAGKGSDKYPDGDTRGWKLPQARTALRQTAWRRDIVDILYRPFDVRSVVFNTNVVDWPRGELMSQMIDGNTVALSTTRSTEIKRGWEHAFCSNALIQHHTVSLKEVNYLFPLYLPSNNTEGLFGRRPNLTGDFIAALHSRVGLEFSNEEHGDLRRTVGAKDVFDYMYAVLYSPTYRSRYTQFLKNDFPRIPLTSDKNLFAKLCRLGQRLIGMHLLNTSPAKLPGYPIAGANRVEDVSFAQGRIKINSTQYFDSVSSEVWEYHIGGYQVAEKWLKDRRGRMLTFDDLDRYRRILAAIRETIEIQEAIDEAIPEWPIP